MKLFNKENLFVRQPVTRKFALTKINASVSMQGTSKNKRKCLGHYDIRESVLIPNRSCEKMNVVDIIIIRCYLQHKIFRADHNQTITRANFQLVWRLDLVTRPH